MSHAPFETASLPIEGLVFSTPDGIPIHYVRQGAGAPVLLLHGWPGFWFDWRRIIPELSRSHDVIAPDFRGFGRSGKPAITPRAYGPEISAADMIALLDALDLERVTLVGHDIGATIAQAMARRFPDRVEGLVLLDPPYPGIAERRFEPAAQREFWYQHLHDLPLFEELVARDRRSVTAYLRHFYDHWIGRKESLEEEDFQRIVDCYAQPGAMVASIGYYRARSIAKSGPPLMPSPVRQPTSVLWGTADPVIPAFWADRLPQFFRDVRLKLLAGVGHFAPFEAPDAVIAAVRDMS